VQDIEQSEYFNRRADEEREAANTATDERAAQSHRELADRYDAKAKDDKGSSNENDGDESDGGTLSKDFRILP
jgi:hypothetical protein